MRFSFGRALAVALLACSAFVYAQVATDTKDAAKDTGHATKVAAKDTGHGVKKGTKAVGHGVKKAGKKTEDVAK